MSVISILKQIQKMKAGMAVLFNEQDQQLIQKTQKHYLADQKVSMFDETTAKSLFEKYLDSDEDLDKVLS